MIATGRQSLLGSWWLSMFPGLAIVSVLSFDLFGDTLRDVLDVTYEA